MGVNANANNILVGIPTYKRPEALARCLAALADQTHQGFDLFVNYDAPVTQCSSDTVRFWLDVHRRNREVFTHQSSHEGQVAAHNMALWDVGSEYEFIFRLDDDIILNPTAIERALRLIKSDPKAGAVGGLWFDGRGARKQLSLPEYKKGLSPTVLDQHIQSAYPPPEKLDTVAGVHHLYSACLYRTAAMRSVGGWGELFSLHVAHREETEGTIRLGRGGHTLLVDPSIRGQHLWFPSGGVRIADANALRGRDEAVFQDRLKSLTVARLPLNRKPTVGLFSEHVGTRRKVGAARIVGGGERLFYLALSVLQKFPDIDVYALAHDNLMSPDMAQRYFGFTYEPTGKPPTKYDLQFSISHFPRKATKAAAYSGLILFPSVEPHHIHEFATIYAISQYTAGYVEQYWGRHADILYPPTTYSCDDRMPVKKDLMLCIGRLVTFKRHAEIAQAFMQAQMPPGWELVIAGTTGENAPYEAELAELARQNKKITLLTNVTDAELKELYDRAKILVGGMGLYSTTPHGFEHWGLTQVEAMSRGCVPVMFSGGGHREPYQKYLWNSLEELVRTLRHLSEQGDELSRQSNEVREKAREYTVPIFAKKLHRAIMESIYGTVDQEGRAQALMGVKAMELSTSAVSGLFGVGLLN